MAWQGKSMGEAWQRYGMCELALNVPRAAAIRKETLHNIPMLLYVRVPQLATKWQKTYVPKIQSQGYGGNTTHNTRIFKYNNTVSFHSPRKQI
jgi:hypothetical protein